MPPPNLPFIHPSGEDYPNPLGARALPPPLAGHHFCSSLHLPRLILTISLSVSALSIQPIWCCKAFPFPLPFTLPNFLLRFGAKGEGGRGEMETPLAAESKLIN
jgi:hypothetical protein